MSMSAMIEQNVSVTWSDAVTWPILETIGAEERQALLRRAQRRRYARNQIVFHEGDPAAALHLLTAGRVSVRVVHGDSGSVLTLAVLGPGSTFGELALIRSAGTRAATITALEDVQTLSLHRDDFDQVRAAHAGIDRFLIELLAEQVRRLDERLLEVLYVPAERRVLRRLVELAGVYGEGRPGTVVPLTQEMLASMAGTTRPTANQALRKLTRARVVSMGRSSIRILDPAGLARRAGLLDPG
jgi:CRP/FNR family transcriptional regulator, cyclic AMP receptor protein